MGENRKQLVWNERRKGGVGRSGWKCEFNLIQPRGCTVANVIGHMKDLLKMCDSQFNEMKIRFESMVRVKRYMRLYMRDAHEWMKSKMHQGAKTSNWSGDYKTRKPIRHRHTHTLQTYKNGSRWTKRRQRSSDLFVTTTNSWPNTETKAFFVVLTNTKKKMMRHFTVL